MLTNLEIIKQIKHNNNNNLQQQEVEALVVEKIIDIFLYTFI